MKHMNSGFTILETKKICFKKDILSSRFTIKKTHVTYETPILKIPFAYEPLFQNYLKLSRIILVFIECRSAERKM